MLRLTRRVLETWSWEPDWGPERKQWNSHRTLKSAHRFPTLLMSGDWKRGQGSRTAARSESDGTATGRSGVEVVTFCLDRDIQKYLTIGNGRGTPYDCKLVGVSSGKEGSRRAYSDDA